ncbi:MAG: ABC transporter substrate-binding protein, partial [Burkholderiales bacterium]
MPLVRTLAAIITGLCLLASFAGCGDQQQYEQGISDTEIKIGNTMPYSGPLSAYGTIGHAIAAYFDMVNEKGGINGRKITFITLDDGYSPPKTVEQIRRLVEEEKVALLSGNVGTPTNSAVHEYVNAQKIPHLFIQSGASKWGDPENHPWTMGWTLNYLSEGIIYGRYILETKPDAKIAVIYQNDDYGKDLLEGLRQGLGNKAESMIVATASYEATDPTVDSQVVSLKASGADTLITIASAKFAAQVIRKVYDIGWQPLHIVNGVSTSIASVLRPAGLEKSKGIISVGYMKDPSDPQWDDDEDMRDYKAWFEEYFPQG